jgi:hypothetical protein
VKKKGGRPSKISDMVEVHREGGVVSLPITDAICDVLKLGNYLETAAAVVGIERQTLYNWIEKGRRAKSGPYRQFFDAVEKAQSNAESLLVGRIMVAGVKEWQANAWMLERKWPRKYGRQVQIVVRDELTAFVDFLEGALDGETFRRVVDVVASYSAGRSPAEDVGGRTVQARLSEPAGIHPGDDEGLLEAGSPPPFDREA